MGTEQRPGHLVARDEAEALVTAVLTDDEVRTALYTRLRELRPEPEPVIVHEVVSDSVDRHGMPATSEALGIHELYVRRIIDQSAFPSLVILARMRLANLTALDAKKEG